jgi:hypothetical protein
MKIRDYIDEEDVLIILLLALLFVPLTLAAFS